MTNNGRSRVIIESVSPVVDAGLYPAKRSLGERVVVGAHIFGDGHDHIRAFVKYKLPGKRKWEEVELDKLLNDEWSASFVTDQKGVYEFKVEAWIDHLLNWYEGFKKKAAAGVYVNVELIEGANLLTEAQKNLGKKGGANIKKVEKLLRDEKQYDKALNAVLSKEFAEIVEKNPLPAFETSSEVYQISCEHTKANFSTWYEFFPRSVSPEKGKHGTFKDCLRLLPQIADMGFDVLYFPPIHPIGEVNRKGKNNAVDSNPGEPGSPWAIGSKQGGHKAIHPELGTLADYKKVIKEAKKLGIDIALDLAYQCAPDHPYVKEHPQWFKWRPDGTVQYAENPPKKYQDILPFDFECKDWKALWEELKSVVVYWIEAGVRVFRVDNPHTKPIPFWQWLIAEINKQYDDIIFLSEAFTRPKVMASLAKVGFTQGYTYFTWRNTKEELIEYMGELVSGNSRNYFRPNFWPNTPDILPYLLQREGPNAFVYRYALAATLSSNYGMYGQAYEVYDNTPVPGKEEYFNSEKYEIKHYDWDISNRLTYIIKKVNQARKDNPALQSTWNIRFCHVENSNLIAYLKMTADNSNMILTVVNLDSYNRQAGYVQLPLKEMGITGNVNLKLHDLVTDDQYTWAGEWNYVELDPYNIPFHLFKVEIKESNL